MAERGAVTIQPKYEEVQFFFRKHWTHFMKPLIFGLLIGLLSALFLVVIGYLVLMFNIPVLNALFGFIVIAVSILYFDTLFLQIINYFFDMVIVTNHRIIVSRKTVFLRNDNDAVDLTKIQDIGVVAHGFLRNYLNYGALLITLSTSMPPVTLTFVPDPHYYLEQMNRVKRENIIQRQERRGLLATETQPSAQNYLQSIDKL